MAEGNIYHKELSTENITLISGKASGTLIIQRVGVLRIIIGEVSALQRDGAQTTIATLSSSDKPKFEFHAPMTSYGINAQTEFRITSPGGAIQLCFPTGANTNSFKINCVYSVA